MTRKSLKIRNEIVVTRKETKAHMKHTIAVGSEEYYIVYRLQDCYDSSP